MEETNRFAAQVRATLTSPSSRPWHDVDRDDDGYVSGHG